ncbi:MAG TPA: hypothetical protein VHS05_19655 [Pyrinomonadaceae bacterium]|nr:hypothetical protein [Pyrinomonadaceae bacterium]
MRFYRYGIDLERLEAKHLEMVRLWRNQKAVRLRMRYQEEISVASQADWFKKLDTHNDWYFVAIQNEKPFGLFHIKEVDWSRRSGEAGGFVGNPELIGATESGLGILALMDFAFLVLDLDLLEASYRRSYPEIVLLNRQLGYEIFADGPDDFVRARVSAVGYLRATEKMRQTAARIHGAETRLTDADEWLAARIKSLPSGGAC